jgi:hypothetical protein
VEDNPNPEGIAVTQDELIKCGCWFTDTGTLVTDDIDLNAFAKLVAEKEREACAKIADEWAVGWPHPSQSIAEWIRKRT